MKTIAFFLLLLLAACSTSTVDTSKPDEMPEWMRWGTYEHYAYLDNRMYFNADSTIVLIKPERKQAHDYGKVDFTKDNVVLKRE